VPTDCMAFHSAFLSMQSLKGQLHVDVSDIQRRATGLCVFQLVNEQPK